MNYEEFNERKSLSSDFNEAKFQIIRLHDSWEKCKSHARSGKLIDWNWELDNIFEELSTDAEHEDEDQKKHLTYAHKIKKLNELVATYKTNDEALYQILRMKAKILKRLQDVAGKGSKRSSGDDDGIDG